MSFELQILFGAVALLFFLLAFQGALVPFNQGISWGIGSRDEARSLSNLQGRAARTVANHMESLAMFAPLILIAHLAEISTTLTVWGAAVFLIARIAFAAVYLAGIPVVRTGVWTIGLVGILMIATDVLEAMV